MPFLKFTVDSKLLEELGERLVGKPYIALAELVKNSYDADATRVRIQLDPQHSRIEVSDDGQGMSFEDFQDYWMRVGSRHKERQKESRSLRKFNRPLTGSKGIGRLAVQVLAHELHVSTVSEKDQTRKIEAHVKWDEAVTAGDLTEAKVEYAIERGKEFAIGTTITLTKLNHKWDVTAVRQLAKEIWWLRPPRIMSPSAKTAQDFDVTFESSDPEFVVSFSQQMDAILDIWSARIVGRNDRGNVAISLQFRDEEPITHKYTVPPPCRLEGGDFDIRIYSLFGKQRRGIRLDYAKGYLTEFGGVHVYDGSFHLPYYGDPENDWLRIEFDHSHRLSRSELLPEKLQVPEGMNFLPTLSRILGFVNVGTSKEQILKIAITRDRFQESIAFGNLKAMVRYAMDFYAVNEAIRARPRLLATKDIPTLKFQNLTEIIEKHRSELPAKTYQDLREDIGKAAEEIESEAELTAERVSYFGPLATAGITSLAYQHELKQQFALFDDIVAKIDLLRKQVKDERLAATVLELKADLVNWLKRAEMTNALFAYYGDAENMQTRKRFSAKNVIDDIWNQTKFLGRGTEINSEKLEEDLLLPKASLLEWGSIFQNVFLNAFNAMVDTRKKILSVSSREKGRQRELLVQDTGVGVDLNESEKLFQPFVRKMKISPERQALGYGGSGLGLTIVRLIAHSVAAEVSFVKPDEGFRTSFSIRWSEEK
jgi:signal transduction histidine kinase